ncbi:uncharacterized protein LOC141905369 isoform X1 [Tubulanus polymorphus]|uniref:uncharacterized protein LOC141905369 isoform X1 n=1 Tax=Tubulanus polymorphus TaxID=672921 RepID=UPI003DA2D5E0
MEITEYGHRISNGSFEYSIHKMTALVRSCLLLFVVAHISAQGCKEYRSVCSLGDKCCGDGVTCRKPFMNSKDASKFCLPSKCRVRYESCESNDQCCAADDRPGMVATCKVRGSGAVCKLSKAKECSAIDKPCTTDSECCPNDGKATICVIGDGKSGTCRRRPDCKRIFSKCSDNSDCCSDRSGNSAVCKGLLGRKRCRLDCVNINCSSDSDCCKRLGMDVQCLPYGNSTNGKSRKACYPKKKGEKGDSVGPI